MVPHLVRSPVTSKGHRITCGEKLAKAFQIGAGLGAKEGFADGERAGRAAAEQLFAKFSP